MEGVVLALALITPWMFGGVDPVFEFAIAAGLALLLILWAALTIASGQLSITRCPVTLVLALLFLAGLVQLVPLPQTLLRVISPGATDIRQEMYPQTPERLSSKPDVYAVGPPTWPTTTVYPHATRANVFRWLGLLVLFAAVRNQVASTGSLWRLSLLMLANGCLLAVFGLYQAFSKTAHQGGQTWVFWLFPAAMPFGPFINRNHFAAYINVCIALGIGLLAWLGPTEQDRKQRYMVKPNAPMEQREVWGTLFSPFVVLHSPAQLWTLVGVGLMTAALMCSLSRGGFVSLVVALIATMCLRLNWPPRIRRLEVLLIPIVLIVGLFAFIGFRPLESRLGTIFSASTLTDTRWAMWKDLISLTPRFWLLGSGYGTLGYVEPLGRGPTTFGDMAMFVEHAHNDYLEALVEGGLVRGVLTLLLVGFIFAAGFRGLRRYLGRTPGALASGAMIAFLAVALHSTVDFAMTTPAVAILAAIVVAQLVALNRADPTKPPDADHARSASVDLGPGLAVAVAVTALSLGGLMVFHAWQADRVYRLKLEAFKLVPKTGPAQYHKAIDFLEAAAKIASNDAELQSDLGQAWLDYGRSEKPGLQNLNRLPSGPFWLAVGSMSVPVAMSDLVLWNHAPYINAPLTADQESGLKTKLFEEFTFVALERLALARRLCPLLARPELRFAAHAHEMVSADPPSAYWDRALILAPCDPDLWFFAGVQRLRDKKPQMAWEDWKKSLVLFPPPLYDHQKQRLKDHLAEMVRAAAAQAGAEPRRIGEQLNAVLPNRPEEILAAAELIDPKLSATGPARPLLDRAIGLLADRAEGLSPETYHLKAQLLSKLGDVDGAIRAYGQALAIAPAQDNWRMEYVKMLMDERRWKDAITQLTIFEELQKKREKPFPDQAKNWLDEAKREQRIDRSP
jgi:O-antigen ligase/tetratricopeptide (TPR) repeat protein